MSLDQNTKREHSESFSVTYGSIEDFVNELGYKFKILNN